MWGASFISVDAFNRHLVVQLPTQWCRVDPLDESTCHHDTDDSGITNGAVGLSLSSILAWLTSDLSWMIFFFINDSPSGTLGWRLLSLYYSYKCFIHFMIYFDLFASVGWGLDRECMYLIFPLVLHAYLSAGVHRVRLTYNTIVRCYELVFRIHRMCMCPSPNYGWPMQATAGRAHGKAHGISELQGCRAYGKQSHSFAVHDWWLSQTYS